MDVRPDHDHCHCPFVWVCVDEADFPSDTPHLGRCHDQYGGMKADDAKRLKELERENGRLKAIVADQALENRALKEISRGNW